MSASGTSQSGDYLAAIPPFPAMPGTSQSGDYLAAIPPFPAMPGTSHAVGYGHGINVRSSFREAGFAMRVMIVTSSLMATVLVAGAPRAFEGQPSLRAGAGLERYHDLATSTAVSAFLGASYSLNDWMDLRGAVSESRHSFCRADSACGDQTWHFALQSALAMKLDVIQWVPYAGPTLGLEWLTGGPLPRPGAARNLSAGVLVGIDYLPARSYGLGMECGYRALLAGFPDRIASAGVFSAELHAEYRWGW